MFSQLKRLGADSLLYAFMNVGTKIIAFVLFPIYTYYIPDPTDMGVLELVDRTVAMITFIVIFGTDSALAYYYYEYEDKKKRLAYIRTVMTFRISMVVLMVLIAISAQDLVTDFLHGQAHLLYIALGTLFLDTILALVLTILRYEFKTKRVVVTTIAKMFLIAVLSVAALAFVWTSIEGILIARLISSAIIIIVLLGTARRYIVPYFNKEIIKEILIYATPLVPASIAFWVILNANVFILEFQASTYDVGIYTTAIKFATFITLITSGVQMAWRPFSMSIKKKDNSPQLFSAIYGIILMAGAFGVLLLATIMPWVITILSDKYHAAYPYVAPIAIATFLNFYYLIVSVGIYFTKQTKHISIAFGVASVISIGLSLLLIPVISLWGAVISYIISYVVALVLIFVKSQKLYYVPFSGLKMAWAIGWLIIATFGIVTIQINELNPWYIAGIWFIYILLLIVVRFDRFFKAFIKG